MSSVDRFIREISLKDAQDHITPTWLEIEGLIGEKKAVTRELYLNMVRYSARIILAHVEKGCTESETWPSYCDFFLQVMLSWGTTAVNDHIMLVKRVLNAVLQFITEPADLVEEYSRCAFQQRHQREETLKACREGKIELASTDLALLLASEPDLEFDGPINAVADAVDWEEAAAYVSELPRRLTFAHKRGIIRLTLCNPLQIPKCSFVTYGYSCDTCRLKGLRAAFQAMLYEEGGEGAERQEAVRSAAQLSRDNYGYDMCVTCAVHFYRTHRLRLSACLSAPFAPCALGHAAGVAVGGARHAMHRRLVVAGSPAHRGSPSVPPLALTPTSISTSASASQTTPEAVKARAPHGLPPGWRDSRKPSGASDCTASASSSRGAVTPPLTRCSVARCCCVEIEAGIAPYEARPIAWVLPPDDGTGLEPLLPPADWVKRLLKVSSPFLGATNGRVGGGARTPGPGPGLGSGSDSEADLVEADARGSPASSDCGGSHASETDECPICLRALHTAEVPIIATRCGHVFHVECINKYVASAENRCPLCRREEALPEQSRAATLAANRYRLSLLLSPEEQKRECLRIGVAVFINRGNSIENITNIAAATTFTIRQGQMVAFSDENAVNTP